MNVSFATDWTPFPPVISMIDRLRRRACLRRRHARNAASRRMGRIALASSSGAARRRPRHPLRPLTSLMPKSLIQVAGEPFLAHQLRLIHAGGIREVVLCCGFLGEQIEDFAGDGSEFGLSITYSHDGPDPLGTGGALLRRAAPARPALPRHVRRQLAHRAHRAHLALVSRLRQAGADDRLLQPQSLGRQQRRVSQRRRRALRQAAILPPPCTTSTTDSTPSTRASSPTGRSPSSTSPTSGPASLAYSLLAGFETSERFYEIGSLRRTPRNRGGRHRITPGSPQSVVRTIDSSPPPQRDTQVV